jgi:hypothetical protein
VSTLKLHASDEAVLAIWRALRKFRYLTFPGNLQALRAQLRYFFNLLERAGIRRRQQKRHVYQNQTIPSLRKLNVCTLSSAIRVIRLQMLFQELLIIMAYLRNGRWIRTIAGSINTRGRTHKRLSTALRNTPPRSKVLQSTLFISVLRTGM